MKLWVRVLVLLILGCFYLYYACFDMFHKLYFDYDMVTYKEFLWWKNKKRTGERKIT